MNDSPVAEPHRLPQQSFYPVRVCKVRYSTLPPLVSSQQYHFDSWLSKTSHGLQGLMNLWVFIQLTVEVIKNVVRIMGRQDAGLFCGGDMLPDCGIHLPPGYLPVLLKSRGQVWRSGLIAVDLLDEGIDVVRQLQDADTLIGAALQGQPGA